MAVISVDIPDSIAKKVKPFMVVKYEVLEDLIQDEYKNIVDFGEKGVEVGEVLSYLKGK